MAIHEWSRFSSSVTSVFPSTSFSPLQPLTILLWGESTLTIAMPHVICLPVVYLNRKFLGLTSQPSTCSSEIGSRQTLTRRHSGPASYARPLEMFQSLFGWPACICLLVLCEYVTLTAIRSSSPCTDILVSGRSLQQKRHTPRCHR